MKVFVTGAPGFIGTAVVKELLGGGHQVLGLSRSDKGAETLSALGAEVHRGSLDDLDSLKRGATACDGVIHLAFKHDLKKFEEACHADRAAIEAMGEALSRTNKPLIISSGTAIAPHGRLATEKDTPDTTSMAGALRGASETLALSLTAKGVRAMVVRLPPTVHGDGDRAFVPTLISTARQSGASVYAGDGQNRWPAVHRRDAAILYKLAFENGDAGSTFHAVAEQGIALKDIATVIGERLNVPVASKTVEEMQGQLGFLAHVVAADNPTSSEQTRKQLGWSPTHVSLIADIKEGKYFDSESKPAINWT